MWIFDRGQPGNNPYTQEPYQQITQLSYMTRPMPWRPYPHFHEDEFEITMLESGNFTLELPGHTIDLGAGSAVLVPPRIAHAYVHRSGVLHSHAIRFRDQPQRCGRWRRLTAGDACYLENCAQSSSAWELAGLIQHVAAENGGIIDARVQTLAQGIMELMAKEFQTHRTAVPADTPEYANDILIYLQTHIHEKVTMEDLSRIFHLSASHISRVFSRAYHTSPINYLIYRRMQAARLYLLRGELPVAEIAKRLSYHDTYHFPRAFEQFFGCPPERYREETEDSQLLAELPSF